MARPRSFKEPEVVARAVDLFLRTGYEATSLSDLEQATGLGRRSLYNTFGDKEGLLVVSLEHFAERAAEKNLQPMEEPSAGLDAIVSVLRGLAVDARSEMGAFGCLICNTAREPVAATSERVRDRVSSYFERIEAAFANAIGNALPSQPTADQKRDRLAAFMTGILVGACVLARSPARRELLDDFVGSALEHLKSQITAS